MTGKRHRRIARYAIDTRLREKARRIAARAARKADHRNIRMARLEGSHDSDRRRHHPARELIVGQDTGPAVEDLQCSGAGLHLPIEIIDRDLDQNIDQRREALRITVCPAPRVRMIRRAAALDHVGRDRPRRPAKSDERRLGRQILPQARDGLENDSELSPHRANVEPLELIRRTNGLELRALALEKFEPLTERIRHDENVREQDRRVEAVAPDRLQRDFRGQRRIVAKVEKTSGLGARRAILRQVAPGLTHQPDRRRRQSPPLEGREEPLLDARAPDWRGTTALIVLSSNQ